MRLAYFTPLNPLKSGISDYSEELLPQLASAAEIEIFIDNGYTPSNAAIRQQFPIHNYQRFTALHAQKPYDLALYHMGNNAQYHTYIYYTLLRYPGVVVLHDFVLHDFIAGLTLGREDKQGYVEEMRYAYGEEGARLAQEAAEGRRPPLERTRYPLCQRVLDASLGVIVHSEFTRRQVLQLRPHLPVAKVNSHFCLPTVPGPTPAQVRTTLGLDPHCFIIASFGFVTPAKRPEVLLRAFARFRQRHSDSLCLLVGEMEFNYDLSWLIANLGLGDAVQFTGRVELSTFLQYAIAADLCVNLRYPTSGETSASLIRLLGLGKPVIVSNVGAFAELPDNCCAKLEVDSTEEDMLVAYLNFLAENVAVRQEMGTNAAQYIRTQHSLAASARGYLDFLTTISRAPRLPATAHVPVPPAHRLSADLAAALSQTLVGMGLREDDVPALEALAHVIVELDIVGG